MDVMIVIQKNKCAPVVFANHDFDDEIISVQMRKDKEPSVLSDHRLLVEC